MARVFSGFHQSFLIKVSDLAVRRFSLALFLVLGMTCTNSMPAAARDLAVVKPVMDCGALAKMVLNQPEFQGRVESAVLTSEEAPPPKMLANMTTAVKSAHPFCNVKGYLTPQVHFELHLPMENWTQRLVFEGCGGLCGSVMLFGIFGGDNCQPVADGEFATVTSDLGHSTQKLTNMDAVWAADKQLRVDFGHRGVHVTTLAAKQIVERFYGRPQAFAYFDGCSDGGREAMVSVERYPADFNGVIAGAPVLNEVANNTIYHAWGVQRLINPDGKKVFSDAAIETLHKAVIAACGTVTGDSKVNLVLDPTKCHYDPSAIACKGSEKADSCLTSDQVKAAHELYVGPHDPEGHLLYYGYDYGSELLWNREADGDASWGPGSFPGYLASDPPDPTAEFRKQVFTRDAVKKNNVFANDLNALDTDLHPFQRAGGKLIIWQGWGDIAVATMPTVNFYHALRERFGPQTGDFVRLYMLPGVAHCGGGEGPDKMDLMATIMKWTEDGIAPGPMNVVKKDPSGAVTAKEVIEPYL